MSGTARLSGAFGSRTGDLVLIPGSDGTAANPGHVGMVAGVDTTGKVWLVEAPRVAQSDGTVAGL